jgi:hypothetical protein
MDNYYKRNLIIKSTNIKPTHTKTNYYLSDKSINQYQIIIERLHLKYAKNKFNYNIKNIFENDDVNLLNLILQDMKYLNYKFIQKLKDDYKNETTFKTYLIPIVKLLSYADSSKYNKLYRYYASYMIDSNNKYEKERNDNYISEENVKKIITDFSNETLLNNVEKLDDINNKLIYALYTLIPPRRLEYANMYIINKSKKINNKDNYLVIYKYKPVKVIFQDYKTNRTFGVQSYDIPDELAKIIKKYIYKNKLKSGDKLLPFNEKYLSEVIGKIFFKIYGEKINLNYIRKSYATHINEMNISNNSRSLLALAMGHSLAQSAKYKKIINE